MLSPAQVHLVSELADHLYEYLPGSSQWGSYTFQSAAREAGVAALWPGGSKLPAITALLEGTLDQKPGVFVRLIEKVVMGGIRYRRRKNPVSREDVQFV